MKKKCLMLLTVLALLLTGCGKTDVNDVIGDLQNKIEKSKGYVLTGNLEIVNNDDVYNYDVSSSYQDGDYYKISLVNTANDHEQIILKNDDGLYVLTPSLKKSFKFQSDWPYNNSQIYLLQSILTDIENDSERVFENNDNGFIFTSKVNYPNNRNITKQEVTFDKDLNLTKVVVMTADEVPKMTLTVKDIDYSPKFNDDYFDLNAIMDDSISDREETDTNDNNTNDSNSSENSNTNEENTTTEENNTGTDDNSTNEEATTDDNTSSTGIIDDVIYPLVLPEGTKLSSEEKVAKTDGERDILTFDGDKPFLLVEETVVAEDELTIIPTTGEPYMFMDTIGVLSDNSLTWTSGNMEYYIVSDVMSQDELVEIASSVNILPTMK